MDRKRNREDTTGFILDIVLVTFFAVAHAAANLFYLILLTDSLFLTILVHFEVEFLLLIPFIESPGSHYLICNQTDDNVQVNLVRKMELIEKMSTEKFPKKIVNYLLYALALAMGVATIILPLVGQPVDQILVGIEGV